MYLTLNLLDSKASVLKDTIIGQGFTMTAKIIFLIFMTRSKQLRKKFVLQDGALHLISFLKDHKVLRQASRDWIVHWVEQQKEE